MDTALHIITARSDLDIRCYKCRGRIRDAQEYAMEPWGNGGGFDVMHVECPEPVRSADPSARVIQGAQ